MFLAVALSACSAGDVPGPDAAGHAEPVGGGVLRVGTTADVDPAAVFADAGDAGSLLIAQVYDTLLDIPADGRAAEPRLATSWQISEDSITLDLRDDVTFHTGRPFTSEDVEFSVRTWADPAWGGDFQATAAAVTGFDTSDPHRITLRSERSTDDVLDLLDVLPIVDARTFGRLADGEGYVGTGPFRFDSWTSPSTLVLDRNDDYWDDPAYLDRVEVHISSDPRSLALQLRDGQLDLIQGANRWDIESLSRQRYFEPIPAEARESADDVPQACPALAVAEVEGVSWRGDSELSLARAWLDR